MHANTAREVSSTLSCTAAATLPAPLMKLLWPRLRLWSQALLALLFGTAGTLHFIFPAQYASTMPPWLPWHGELVALSGLCEIAGGIGLLIARTKMAAGIGLTLLSIAVLPANVQMLIDAQHAASPPWQIALLWLRLPLQALLIAWIWRVARR